MISSLRIQLITIGIFSLLPVIVSAQQLETIAIGEGPKRGKPVFLKDIAQEVEYLFLETTDQCRISGPGHLIAANSENIIVADRTFFRFDRQSDLIRMLEKSSVNDNPVIMLVTPK